MNVIDPDCAQGKHGSCMGGPCECPCHDEGGLQEADCPCVLL